MTNPGCLVRKDLRQRRPQNRPLSPVRRRGLLGSLFFKKRVFDVAKHAELSFVGRVLFRH